MDLDPAYPYIVFYFCHHVLTVSCAHTCIPANICYARNLVTAEEEPIEYYSRSESGGTSANFISLLLTSLLVEKHIFALAKLNSLEISPRV